MSEIQKYVPASAESKIPFWAPGLVAVMNAHTTAECEKAVEYVQKIAIERGSLLLEANARIAELNEVSNSAYRQAAAERLRADDGWARYEAENKKANDLERLLADIHQQVDRLESLGQRLVIFGADGPVPWAGGQVQHLVDRAIPPVERRVVDCDVVGNPIYADEVGVKP